MTALLVPIQLDALVVREAGQSWALTRLSDPRPEPTQNRRQQLLPDPFQERPDGRPPGVYLHWAMPDGLTRATTTADGSKRFPAVPDRWLVIRLSGPVGPGQRSVRAWLIPDANAQAPSVIDPNSGAPIPASGPAPARPLTVAGPGDLAWAGYYDNVEGRLALYDSLAGGTDVTGGSLAYLVCGWYANLGLDPVAATSAADSAVKLAALGWSYDPAQLPAGVGFPASCLLHGSAVGIGWPNQHWPGDGGLLGAEADLRPEPGAISAAIGETMPEALAMLTSQAQSSQALSNQGVDGQAVDGQAGAGDPLADPARIRLIEGLLASALTELDRPDGPAQLDTALHTSRFGAKAAPHLDEWIWEPGRQPGAAAAKPAVTAADDSAGPLNSAGRPVTAAGDLASALASSQAAGSSADDQDLAGFHKVLTTQPRVWHALDPELVLSGAGRSGKHGADGRFTATGTLSCRIEGHTLTAFGLLNGNPGQAATALPSTPLTNPAGYGIPAACSALIIELAALDPGCAPDLGQAGPTSAAPVAAMRARFWLLRDPSVPPATALAGAAVAGTLPSPLAVTPPSRPWVPLHLDWSASYRPSPRGAHDWQLTDLDFELPGQVELPPVDPRYLLQGRIMLSSAPAKLAGASDPASGGLSEADLLSGALTGIMQALRGDPTGAIVHPTKGKHAEPDPGPRPDSFRVLRAGFLQLNRLRLVDGFGQYLDLLPGPLTVQAGPGMQVGEHPELFALKPRFTAESRVMLRYSAASGDHVDADTAVSPLCGFVVPSPLDGTLEFFDADGSRLGRLRPDEVAGTAWEDDPGLPATLGVRPSQRIPNPYLAGFAEALLAADTAAAGRAGAALANTALEAFVRVIDVTRWSTDETGRAGDEHLAMLLGKPVAVMRATVLLDVQDPRKAPEIALTSVPIKLGTLAHLQDGLLAYVVGDDLSRVRVVDPVIASADAAIAAAAQAGFVDASDVFTVQPGTPVALTLFVVPQTDVHATVGLLPQKAVGMLREWTAPGLGRLSPAFRYGPVLRELTGTRLPIPSDVRGSWTWHRRADLTSWAADEVVAATGDALIGDSPVLASDGWLSVTLLADTQYTKTAQQIRITHIRSRTYRNKGKQVLAVGGENADGSHFLVPVQQAARLQESGRFAFYVQEQPDWPRRDVHVITRRDGVKYLRTTNDKRISNNLVALPEAPADW